MGASVRASPAPRLGIGLTSVCQTSGSSQVHKQNGLSAGGILRPLETSRRALGQNVDRSVAWLAEIEISDR